MSNPSLEAWFQPMGLTLHIHSNSPAIIRAAETSFGGFGQIPLPSTADLTFHLFAHDVDDGVLGQPVFRTHNNLIYQTTGRDSTLVVDVAAGTAYGYFSATTLADQAFFRWHFLELACFVMLKPRGLMGVHGAALAKNGQAILLRAASGGGKTTLAYAGARSRFQALAEDVVWIDVENNRWWGTPWSFHLLPDAKQLFPELASYQPILQTNQELKLEVNLETIRSESTTVSADPGPVVFVERRAGGTCALESIDLETAKQLWAIGYAGTEQEFPNYEQHITALLKNNAYRFYSGDDLERGLDLLEPLFNR
ncbi:MAG: hypothetical protein AAF485_26275 [Chloroflexota bacterium]